MGASHSQEARTAALATGEPQDDCQVGWLDNQSDTADKARLQVRNRRSHGLNRSERRWCVSREQAEAQAARVREHWRQRGVAVETWIVPLGGLDGVANAADDECAVRSSLIFRAAPATGRAR